MNRITQVFHILKKDVVALRWGLILYAIAVVALVLHATDVPRFRADAFQFLAVLTELAFLVIAAAALQADPPSTPTAFWASRPLQRTSVVSAKILFLLLMLAFATISQIVALHSFSLTLGQALQLSLVSAQLALTLALTAMLLAALTRGIGMLLLAGIGLIVVSMLAVIVIPMRSLAGGLAFSMDTRGVTNAPAPTMLYALFALSVQFATLYWLYHRRDRRGLTVVAGVAAILCSWWNPLRNDEPVRPALRAGTDLPQPIWSVVAPKTVTNGTDSSPAVVFAVDDTLQLSFSVRLDSIPFGTRVELDPVRTTLVLRDSSRLHSKGGGAFVAPFGGAYEPVTLPRESGLQWSAITPPAQELRVGVSLRFDQTLVKRSNIVRVELDARGYVYEARIDTVLPLAVGARIERAGWSAQLTRWQVTDDAPIIELETRGLPLFERAMLPLSAFRSATSTFALINSSRTQGVSLQTNHSSSQGRALPLLGPAPFVQKSTLTVRRFVPAIPPPTLRDASWKQDVGLAIIHLVPRGSYPVRLSYALP